MQKFQTARTLVSKVLTITIFVLAFISRADAENLIKNGNFDEDLTGWSKSSQPGNTDNISISSASVCVPAHTTKAAAFNVYSNRVGTLTQSVTLPAPGSTELKFLVWGQYQATNVTIKIIDGSSVSHTLETFVAPQVIDGYTFPGPVFDCNDKVPVTKTYDLTAYAGQTITLSISATSSGNDGTFALFDDIEINYNGISGGPTPTPNPDDNRRPTATKIFCNRSGPNLETVKCSATVADAGPPPRQLPAGPVDFFAFDGFFPANAQCQLQQVDFSPGIGSCEAQFAVPANFPIGVKFPIDAYYDGNATFKPSATSHELIKGGCVSTPGKKPCPDSIGLSFEEFPKVKKSKLPVLIGCGGTSKSGMDVTKPDEEEKKGGVCTGGGGGVLDVKRILKEVSYLNWVVAADQITDKDAKADALVYVARELGRLTPEQHAGLISNDAALTALEKDILNNKVKKPKKGQRPLDPYINITSGALKAKKVSKGKKSLQTATFKVTIKPDTQKTVNLKLGNRLNKAANLLRKANSLMPLTVNITMKQKNRAGSAKFSESIDVVP